MSFKTQMLDTLTVNSIFWTYIVKKKGSKMLLYLCNWCQLGLGEVLPSC